MANLYARVKPLNPRQGYVLNRYHYLGNLFVGGPRPTWYKVSPEYAAYCRQDVQETGVPSFDVVTEAEKQEIDAKEEQLRLVELGFMSATVAAPPSRQAIDIQDARVPAARGAARAEAVPLTVEKPSGGDLTTGDLALGAK